MILLILEAYAHVCTLLYVPSAPRHDIMHHMSVPYVYRLVMHT